MINDEYNSFGIKNPVPLDGNPVANEDIVYNPAKRPTQGGSLLPGQTIADLTFVSGYSQRRIRINMNPGDNPKQSPGSIAIINERGNIIWSAGDVENTAFSIQFIEPDTDTTALFIRAKAGLNYDSILAEFTIDEPGSLGTAIVVHNNGDGDGVFIETAGAGYPLSLLQDTILGSHFKVMQNYNLGSNFLIISDGTDPNGVVTANQGDLCMNASPAGKLAYCSGGSVWTTL